MVMAIFDADGTPIRIDANEFLRYHAQQFPKLLRKENIDIIMSSIETVYTMFYGVGTIWSNLSSDVYFSKTRTCYRLLVAWYIANNFPRFVSGVPMVGGVGLRSKKIGGVDIAFDDSANPNPSGNFMDLLGRLKSNPFGADAYMMITSSIARTRVIPSR